MNDAYEVMARTVYGEARGAGHDAMVGVAHVIANRAMFPRWWGFDIRSVCLFAHEGVHQFSCWNEGDPNRLAAYNATVDDRTFLDAMHIAHDVIGRVSPDPTGQADHYCAITANPYWAARHKPTAIIGGHKFYRLELPDPGGIV